MDYEKQAVSQLVASLCSAFATCKELNRVISLLQLATTSLLDFKTNHDIQNSEGIPEDVIKNLGHLTSINNFTADAVRTLFYASSFQSFAETLLSGNLTNKNISSAYLHLITGRILIIFNCIYRPSCLNFLVILSCSGSA